MTGDNSTNSGNVGVYGFNEGDSYIAAVDVRNMTKAQRQALKVEIEAANKNAQGKKLCIIEHFGNVSFIQIQDNEVYVVKVDVSTMPPSQRKHMMDMLKSTLGEVVLLKKCRFSVIPHLNNVAIVDDIQDTLSQMSDDSLEKLGLKRI